MLDRACSQTKAGTLVLRNLTYFMEVPGMEEAFPLMRGKQGTDFKFIWEKQVLVSDRRDE